MIKIRGQHYIWRYYLQSWANNRDKLYCLREGSVFPVAPKNIAKERDFYRLKSLTQEDVFFIKRLAIDPAAPHLQQTHLRLLNIFLKITYLNEQAKSSFPEDHETRNRLDILVNNAEELMHGAIEQTGKVYLDALKIGNGSFYLNDKDNARFMHFLCTQHFRTKGLREKLFESSITLGTSDKLKKGGQPPI